MLRGYPVAAVALTLAAAGLWAGEASVSRAAQPQDLGALPTPDDSTPPQSESSELATTAWLEDPVWDAAPSALDPGDPDLNKEEPDSGSCGGCTPHWHHVRCRCKPCDKGEICFKVCRDFGECVTEKYCPHPCTNCYHGTCRQCDQCGGWVCDSCYCDVSGRPSTVDDSIVRFGWWGVHTDGSKTKIGEYQDLDSSPFYDFDAVDSDGVSTYDLFVTGNDQESNQAGLTYYGPSVKADIEFQRYLRRLDHDPLSNFNEDLGFGAGVFEQAPTFSPLPDDPSNPQLQGTRTAPGSTNRASNSQDLNLGQDYAIRVEQIRGEVSGSLSQNLKYRVKLWGLRKFGERQVNGVAHCFNGGLADDGVPAEHPFVPGSGGRSCHVLSRRQQIDWLTEEVVPSIEGRWGPLSLEYSHTVRAFYQDDQALTRYYTGAGNAAGTNADEWRVLGFNVVPPAVSTNGTLADYAFAPENLTHFGQVKAGLELSEYRNLYTIALAGNTHNNNRETDRNFGGVDLRLMDQSVDGFNTVTYAKVYSERNEFPGFIRYDELGPPRTRAGFVTGHSPDNIVDPAMFQPPGTQNPLDPANPSIRWRGSGEFGFLRHPVDYTRTSAGIETRWRPPQSVSGLSLISGYDFAHLDRDHGTFEAFVPLDPANPDPDARVLEEFDLGTTVYHTARARCQKHWAYPVDTYLQYTRRWIDNPLFAVHEPNGVTNSSLPTDEDLIQVGGSWYPTDSFLLTGWFGLENRSHESSEADFDEDSYPIVTTAWYAPYPAWSLTAGYAYFSNWIDQDVTLGDQIGGFLGAGPTGRIELVPATERFSYGGRADVISCGSSYAAARTVMLLGGYEFTRNDNGFDPPATWPDLPTLSAVRVDTQRWTAGIDWTPYDWCAVYSRYVYLDYNDETNTFYSGTAHMVLAGVTLIR